MNDNGPLNWLKDSNRRWLWIAIMAVWVVGCAVLAVGAGLLLGQRSTDDQASEVVVVVTATPAEATATPIPTSTDTPAPTSPPTRTPKPTVTPTATSGPSQGDQLSLPTATVEGVILFLSSRDHDPDRQTANSPTGPGTNRRLELYAMNPDGSHHIRLSDGRIEWWNLSASLTPYYISNQIVINDKTIFDITTMKVVDEIPTTFQDIESVFGFRWSPKGEVVFCGGHPTGLYYAKDLSSSPRKLTNPPDDVWGDCFPSWSPDGEWVAFMRNWYDSAKDGIWLIRPDGSEAHRIFSEEYNRFRKTSWSPDGDSLVMEGSKPNSNSFRFEVWTANTDGENLQQVTSLSEKSSIWEPYWSPDGKKIVLHDGDSYYGDIYIVSIDNGDLQQVTTDGDANLSPIWLPISMDDLPKYPVPLATSIPTPTATPKPPPPPPAPSSCPSPGVQITSPRAGTRFTSRTNYILGTANIPNFGHWKLEYSTDPNGGWQYLFERDYPVDNDKLMMLDASTVPRGPYGLRLTVVDVTGNYPEPCVVWFTNGY